ncbi:Octamer-binding transcription factor [Parasponia andersonii]|uniref:Octamer-binding transcription factor n=1 Tax=Parasponia andersonii TaxID=3476 RepID=A0A2P5CZU5_PARAD|nr:Octamer-binding transcription factor [Parasponia andersonii]
MFSCKPYEVDSDMPIFPVSEDEPLGLEHFLVEPLRKEDWVGDLLDLDAFQIEKCFNIEDISGTFDYDQIKLDAGREERSEWHGVVIPFTSNDAAYPKLTKGEGENLKMSSEKLQGINISVREEYPTDTKCTDEACNLDYSTCKESCLGNGGLENQFQGSLKRDTGDAMVDLTSTNIPMLKYTNNHQSSFLDQVVAKELHEAFKSLSGQESFVTDKNWPKKDDLYGFENYAELDISKLLKVDANSMVKEGEASFSSLVEYSGNVNGLVTGALNNERMSQNQKRKRVDGCESLKTTSDFKVEISSLDEGDKAGLLVSPKRSRKPPRRYIEESLDYETKSHNRKCGIGRKSRDRNLHDRYQKYNWQQEFQAEELVYEDDSFNGGCIQVPFGLPMEKEHPKKNKLSPGFEDSKDNGLLDPKEKLDIEPLLVESQEDISEDECFVRSHTLKGNGRRKRHISWTPEEVVKLVEGVSQCGVGKWTEIKRLLFSSSSHRTSVDLKDKWRNLLRASCTQLQIKEKVEQNRKQTSLNYVPESILCRVRELAVIHPYPRDSRSKVSCTIPAVSSFPASTSSALVPLSTAV